MNNEDSMDEMAGFEEEESTSNMRNFFKRYESFLDSGKLSDFTIVVDESGTKREIKVHKMVLNAYHYFEAALSDGTTEKAEAKLTVTDFSYEVVLAMLRFMYTSRVRPTSWLLAEDLLRAADKYGLPDLSEASAKRLEAGLNNQNFANLLQLALTYNSKRLKGSVIKYIKKNPSVVDTGAWKAWKILVKGSATEALMEVIEMFQKRRT